MPKMDESTSDEDYSKAYAEWQSAYNERVNAHAQGILNTEQLTSFSDYQQWQKEMREQATVRRMSRGQRTPAATPSNSRLRQRPLPVKP